MRQPESWQYQKVMILSLKELKSHIVGFNGHRSCLSALIGKNNSLRNHDFVIYLNRHINCSCFALVKDRPRSFRLGVITPQGLWIDRGWTSFSSSFVLLDSVSVSSKLQVLILQNRDFTKSSKHWYNHVKVSYSKALIYKPRNQRFYCLSRIFYLLITLADI